jgi:hypothetical protein
MDRNEATGRKGGNPQDDLASSVFLALALLYTRITSTYSRTTGNTL